MDNHWPNLAHGPRADSVSHTVQILMHLRNRYLVGADLLALLFIPTLALLVRTESMDCVIDFKDSLITYTLLFLVFKIIFYYKWGLYREFWAYASVPELFMVLQAVGISGVIEVFSYFLIIDPLRLVDEGFPRSVPLISAFLTVFFIVGLRANIRIFYRLLSRKRYPAQLKPVLIAGAGEAGLMVARELQSNPQMGLDPIGFVDDDVKKSGRRISSIPVFGGIGEIGYVVKRYNVEQVIIAMPTVSGSVVRRVNQLCHEAGVASKIIPALYDIIGGVARVSQVRDVQVEDLLQRGVVKTDIMGVQRLLGGARVMITGAGGSIGGEMARQVRSFYPRELIVLGHGETSIFRLMKELEEHRLAGVSVHSVVADIRDADRMDQVFREYRPDVVFHAAAHKHVWLMEQNLADAISNNILGTRTLLQMADRHNVRRFVMVSSDKAVNPTSVMGVTKRIAELLVQDAALRSQKSFVTVRFGNVLGSRGSVVPIFKRQIELGGPVCVTHPEVTRYFMTIPEAVQLVLQAATMGEGGEVFVLDMGKQLKVIDVARDMIRLSGFAEEEIGISITGLKPGEKLYEELFYDEHDIEKTAHEKIQVSRRNYVAEYNMLHSNPKSKAGMAYESRLWMDVDTLILMAKEGDSTMTEQMLKRLVPQYVPARNFEAIHAEQVTAGAPALVK